MNCLMLFCTLMFISAVSGDAFYTRGKCPNSYEPGDRWRPSRGRCMQCTCFEEGFGCYTCGKMIPGGRRRHDGCYYRPAPPTDPYPECCGFELVCEEEEGK